MVNAKAALRRFGGDGCGMMGGREVVCCMGGRMRAMIGGSWPASFEGGAAMVNWLTCLIICNG